VVRHRLHRFAAHGAGARQRAAPREGSRLAASGHRAATNLKTASFTLKEFVTHLVPRSFAEAMAEQRDPADRRLLDVLRVALAALGDIGKPLTNVIDASRTSC
jgi:hypothetical protein